MKVEDILTHRGIPFKEIKEDRDRFTVVFEREDKRAIRAIMKEDYAITYECEEESGWKIKGVKKKDLTTKRNQNMSTKGERK